VSSRRVMEHPHAEPSGRLFWTLTVVGLSIVGFGLAGLVRNSDQTAPGSWLRFFLGGLLAHDLLLAPVVLVASVLLVRYVPARVRPTVQGALLVSGIVLLASIPALGGFGRLANNPSILPNDYTGDLAVVIGGVCAVAFVLGLRARRRPPQAADGNGGARSAQDGW
jgi:hypothetical protein